MTNVKRTREDILESVIELVQRNGFQSTGLKEIFEASNASSGSFYNYFKSKDQLAHDLIDYMWSRIKSNVLQPNHFSSKTALLADPIADAILIIDLIEKNHANDINCPGCLLGNLIVDLAEYDPTFRDHLIQIYDQWQSIVSEKIARGRSQLKPEINPEYLAEQILIIIEGTLLMGRLYNDQGRLHRGFDTARNLLKAAIA